MQSTAGSRRWNERFQRVQGGPFDRTTSSRSHDLRDRTALEDTDTVEAFRRGELAFLLDRDGLTLVQRGPELPPWP
jgi:hypothetical protein